MQTKTNPTWWNKEHDTAWERTKAAFKRDWEQTKHDFGGNEPDTDQDADDTVKQMAGKQPIPPSGVPTFEEHEDDYRLGYGARSQYGGEYKDWDNDLESRLRSDWESVNPDRKNDWENRKSHIRRGWEFKSRV